MLIRPNTDLALFLERGTLRIYVGTQTQIIKKSKITKIDEKTLLLIQLDKSLPVLDFQKVLIHNLSKNMYPAEQGGIHKVHLGSGDIKLTLAVSMG